jgi:hypothetical protein
MKKAVTISSACKYLAVSPSGYYAWRKRRVDTAQKYKDLKAVYWYHHARLGAPSLVHDMHDLGYNLSERTVGRMLKHLGLRSKISVNINIRQIQIIVCLQLPIYWIANLPSQSRIGYGRQTLHTFEPKKAGYIYA